MIFNRQMSASLRPAIVDDPAARSHFAQFGEDVVIWELMTLHNRLANGFYVDVGAHHPREHSNTYLLHRLKSWSGVNIDADPELVAVFETERPNDRNIVAAISDVETDVSLSIFAQRGMSTIDPDMKSRHLGRVEMVRESVIRTRTLTKVLDEIGASTDIGLLSVDVEGADLAVLKSLDWKRYMPFCVCVEDIQMDLRSPQKSSTFDYLSGMGYILMSHVWISSIYYKPQYSRR